MATRRRRRCQGCGSRFTTFERREPEPRFVRKRDGERQPFDRTKLRAAMLRASHKRPVSPHDVETVIERVELSLADAGGELGAARIGQLCLAGLRELDRGAYLQFAGTLPEFPPDLGVGSVRAGREDAQSIPKAVHRRELDE